MKLSVLNTSLFIDILFSIDSIFIDALFWAPVLILCPFFETAPGPISIPTFGSSLGPALGRADSLFTASLFATSFRMDPIGLPLPLLFPKADSIEAS
ncbi:hypothetical protein [Porcincola intestinalis]|uniref:hypothetical protein n=1 Tax=Porcincola intestinalis TaxID=2606632 RepID=UPI002A840456|nr:hypothetical protein [Porcincola intestinalis]MCI7094046.1 hypothetical protein [Lachnospiraceae bacterium]MDY4203918.1 hypothetical protein [Porcincola intestinalis]